ncbi:MAG: glutamyl-tRNA synthetase, partial [Anaerocolumna sp.]|nr:glutamyl-tRNA synthetase [Anaerocolumna sp.]
SIEKIEEVVMGYIASKEIKNGMGLWPLRTAVSGKQSTPGGAYEIMNIVGKDESIRRIKVAIEKLSNR